MTGPLQPVPLRDIRSFPHSFQEWLRKINQILSTSGIAWTLIDFTGSDLADIETRNHNDLQNIQGGSAGSYYHLTSAQHSDITGGASFKTIAVSGQSDVIADSYQDILTLVAGTNVSITTNNTTDTITIGLTGSLSPVPSDAHWEPVSNMNPAAPEIVFDATTGDVVMGWIS